MNGEIEQGNYVKWEYLPLVGMTGKLQIKKAQTFLVYFRAMFQEESEF